jgi:hypothetical protein
LRFVGAEFMVDDVAAEFPEKVAIFRIRKVPTTIHFH